MAFFEKSHELARRYAAQMISPDPAVYSANESLYDRLLAELERVEEAKAAAKAIDADRDLTDDAKKRRRAEKLPGPILAIRKAGEQHLAALRSSLLAAREERAAALTPTMNGDLRDVLAHLQRVDLRNQLAAMDRSERARYVLAAAQRGDRAPFEAVESSLTPLLTEEVVGAAREELISRAAPEATQRARQLEEAMHSAVSTLKQAEAHARATVGLEYRDEVEAALRRVETEAQIREIRQGLGRDAETGELENAETITTNAAA